MGTLKAIETYVKIRIAAQDNNNDLIFIVGGKESDRTCLMLNIQNEAESLREEISVLSLNSKQFINEIAAAIYNGTLSQYTEKCKQADLFMLDGIQHISGKFSLEIQTREILRKLIDSGKQIVITSDMPLNDLIHMDKKLKAVLEDGVTLYIR